MHNTQIKSSAIIPNADGTEMKYQGRVILVFSFDANFSLLQKRNLKSLMYDLQPRICFSWNSWNLYLTLHKDSSLYNNDENWRP